MRLAEPIEQSGFFWLPEKPDNKLHGTLRISESGEITLELIGLLDDPFAAPRRDPTKNQFRQQDFDRILGRVEEYGLVTLDRCIYTKEKISLGGLSTSTLHAHFAFIRVNYERGQEVTFSEFSFMVEGLDEWLSLTGIDVEHYFQYERIAGASIHFSPPEKMSVTLPDGIQLEFGFSWPSPGMVATLTEARVSHKSFMSLKSEEPRSIECFRSLAFKICNFLCLAIDQTVSMESVTARSRELTVENGDAEQRRVPIDVYFQSASYSEVRPNIDRHHALFLYPHIADRLQAVMTKWLASYGAFEPALNLYFTSRYDHRQYIDVRFLRLAQGLETLHRRSSQETEMPKDEFKNHLKSILHSCPKDKRDWLRGKLSSANAFSLRRRLEKMIKPFQHFFGDEEESKSLVSQIVDTRNYLTHYSGKLESKAANHEDLLMLCDKLEALFQLHLLQLIGFDAESIDLIAKDNQSLSIKLRT